MARLLLPGWVSKKPQKKQGKAAGTFQTPLAEGRCQRMQSKVLSYQGSEMQKDCVLLWEWISLCLLPLQRPLVQCPPQPPHLSQPGARVPSGQGLFHGPLAHFLCLKQGKGLGTNVSLFLGKSFFPPALLGTSLLGMEPAAALKGQGQRGQPALPCSGSTPTITAGCTE